ncbi:MAG TPA: hypothetical protein VLD86_08890 [Ilumatobacteraceae bacterium]|nr:hypothetical protein [Ilumatobacteraceae bacterium]
MFHTARLLVTTATLVVATVAPTTQSHHGISATPKVTLIGFSTSQRQLVFHALELFEEAGLPLPAITLRRHDDTSACHEAEGWHSVVGENSIIDLCTSGSEEWEQRTIIHELAHAWSFHYLSSSRRDTFQRVRGWSAWLDYTRAEWEDNGAEQAAEIVVWALSDQAVPLLKIADQGCSELRAGYLALTGREPLNGLTDLCDAVVVVHRS